MSTALDLTPAEQAAMRTDLHATTCPVPLGECVECMSKLRDYRKVIAAARKHLEAEALRAYANRQHGQVEGFAQRTDYGTGVEYDAVCMCGSSAGEDGCSERQQLIADADAFERGAPVAASSTDESLEPVEASDGK